MAHVTGDSPHHITVSGPSLTSASVGKTSYFSLSNVGGTVEDIEVNVEGEWKKRFFCVSSFLYSSTVSYPSHLKTSVYKVEHIAFYQHVYMPTSCILTVDVYLGLVHLLPSLCNQFSR